MNWRIHHVEKTDSTNRLALGGGPGDVFTAAYQSAGRGRLDHKWHSASGENLMMSAVLDVSVMEASEVATLPLVVGLAVADALSAFVDGLLIKWPNDIVVAGRGDGWRKLAGILCERHGDSAIAGIGVNVRQSEFPAEIAARATSLRLMGAKTSVDAVRDGILDSLARLAGEWRLGGFAPLLGRIARLDALRGRIVTIRRTDDDAEGVTGVCGGIAADGSLLVGVERIYAGEAHVVV